MNIYQPDRRHDYRCLKGYAAREFADCMLGIILAVEQCDWWLARIMGRAS